ncbi:hypothetical protein [Flavobacterium oreochromis]|uniref:hypothetical protein n=1 Tax=Flavobacterium oreochromis TaxID=2906078 RepID=UPI00385FF0C2
MKKISLLLLLLLQVTTYSQSITKLDEKNGFKDFKIGDDFNKWKKDLIYRGQEGDEKSYTYNGLCCNEIFDFKIDELQLYFIDNKLFKIAILHINKPNVGDYISSVNPNKINYKLMEMFGKFSSKEIDANSGKAFLFWLGRKVELLSVYEYLGARVGEKFEVLIMKKTDSNSSKEGF